MCLKLLKCNDTERETKRVVEFTMLQFAITLTFEKQSAGTKVEVAEPHCLCLDESA